MLESNQIEGEDRINPGDEKAFDFAVSGIKGLRHITDIHQILGAYLKKPWVGRFRDCAVTVGGHSCPHHTELVELMVEYVANLDDMDSWTAHNEFEKIHPFQDLNGRTGRLIWVSKAIDEGYDFSIPFLQKYYYQTLTQYERSIIIP